MRICMFLIKIYYRIIARSGTNIKPCQKDYVIDQNFHVLGSVLDTAVSVLLDRLRGLCDNADLLPETFHDHEVVFTLKDFSGTGSSGSGEILRARRAIDHPELPWYLRYVGFPETGNYPAILRKCLDVSVSNNVCEFLKELGAKVDHEFVTKGYILKKGRIKVTVFKMFKITQPQQPGSKEGNNLEPVSVSHLVELSVLTTKTDTAVADDLRTLADHLKPLVHLEKIDYRRVPMNYR
ncbi:unnamed protein product [Meganyctiphanes norvegica]|uniref:Mediator of RNA polymerase II transcription subunit 18 n=1 Tax=Meganyctiphanes norvegica TaxID=48144 RepID=A0AAV2QVC5_MEGNR